MPLPSLLAPPRFPKTPPLFGNGFQNMCLFLSSAVYASLEKCSTPERPNPWVGT